MNYFITFNQFQCNIIWSKCSGKTYLYRLIRNNFFTKYDFKYVLTVRVNGPIVAQKQRSTRIEVFFEITSVRVIRKNIFYFYTTNCADKILFYFVNCIWIQIISCTIATFTFDTKIIFYYRSVYSFDSTTYCIGFT